jgi:outer membrane protein W
MSSLQGALVQISLELDDSWGLAGQIGMDNLFNYNWLEILLQNISK